jgi:hypothetical protein
MFRGCSHRSQRSRLQHGKRKLKGRLSAALFLSSSEAGAQRVLPARLLAGNEILPKHPRRMKRR